jgi:hypothetical protein
MLRCRMKRWWSTIGCVLALAGAARAELAPFHDGRFALRFGSLYGIEDPAAQDPGVAGTLEVGRGGDGSLTRIELPASLFQGTAHVDFTGPGPFPPARGVELSAANGAGTFVRSGTGTSAGLGGLAPLSGIHRVCLFFACGDPSATVLTVPLNVIGQGGIASAFVLLRVAIAGAPWSTGSVTVDLGGSMTSMVAGGTSPTIDGGTHVQLVTPLMISTNAIGPDDEEVPPVRGLALLDLVVAPEPTGTALLGAAILSLVWIGEPRRRRRKLV